ncbi:hypothetical protein VB711_26325 [Cronbergia sp. UHCC 0137]|uniref:hypothetical protein n=1 Tax=Cronbergia sp. UHCC 0137 TaxID=3110239 RepID=UPI002B1F8CC1|nr:hypothetical protein [Cronbergia sp. UHCC 0137]MEA5621323.1 hypothetical protein [Cronbergia sp. UHCC 0137]
MSISDFTNPISQDQDHADLYPLQSSELVDPLLQKPNEITGFLEYGLETFTVFTPETSQKIDEQQNWLSQDSGKDSGNHSLVPEGLLYSTRS